MLKVSRLETPFQEIVFLLTIIFSLSIGVGGIFYLNLSSESFVSATGLSGSSLIHWGFNGFGYTYFLFTLFFLHIGHLTLATSHSFKELGRGFNKHLSNFAIDLTVLLLISGFITVLESYNGWKASTHFDFGYGGWFGSLIGGFLFRSFGLYGALVILFSLISIIGISAGYMEIVHSFYVMKDMTQEVLKNIQEHGPKMIKDLKNHVVDFIHQKPFYAKTVHARACASHSSHFDTQGIHRGFRPIMQGGRMTTDHFHLPRFTTSFPKPLTPEPEAPLSPQMVSGDIQTQQHPVVEQQSTKEPAANLPTLEESPLCKKESVTPCEKKSVRTTALVQSKKSKTSPHKKSERSC